MHQRAADADQPAFRGRKRRDLGIEAGADTHARGDRRHVAGDRPPIDQAEARILLDPQHDVLEHRHVDGTRATSWWMKLMPQSVAICGVSMAAGLPSRWTIAADPA